MTIVIDSRSERTRDAILRSFATLLFRDGFDAISVQAIVAGATVARSTFYEHFSGKEDVLCTSMGQFFAVLARCVGEPEQPPALLDVLSHFWENRRLTDAIFSGTPRKIIALSLSELVEARLRADAAKPLRLPSRLAAINIAEAQLALVEAWLRGRAAARADHVAAALHATTRALVGALAQSAALQS